MSRQKLLLWSGGVILCFFFVFFLSMMIGSEFYSAQLVGQVILHHLGFPISEPNFLADVILWKLRFPRIVFAGVVGAALAIAGTMYQGLLRNPLADPYILGVSSGASVGAVLAILMGLATWAVVGASFAAALIALLMVLLIAGKRLNTHTLILSGVVVHAFFGAILTYAISQSDEELPRIQFWLMGSFTLRDWNDVWILTPVLLLASGIAWSLSRELNLFSLGERTAANVGVSVRRIRLILLLTASLLTAVSVAVSGMIGFVGLVIPHVLRLIIGADHRRLLPLAAIAGAIFLIGADTIARSVLSPRELPIGVVTAFLGAPFFAFLLRQNRNLD
ncbi:FecCD family ABC transporter permease [Risungbinella massiliensis]|uniref:FecCD family ABC transporter permease n=1 Tax=Risungbinella massiliensis TaxID=1329796 RepID=UPI0005CBF74B|nr:iron ABC transporter permease [Risungbinella massiliensis]